MIRPFLVGEDIILPLKRCLPLVKLADTIRPYEDRWVFVVQIMICGGEKIESRTKSFHIPVGVGALDDPFCTNKPIITNKNDAFFILFAIISRFWVVEGADPYGLRAVPWLRCHTMTRFISFSVSS